CPRCRLTCRSRDRFVLAQVVTNWNHRPNRGPTASKSERRRRPRQRGRRVRRPAIIPSPFFAPSNGVDQFPSCRTGATPLSGGIVIVPAAEQPENHNEGAG